MKHVIVTGGAGFIGSHLTDALLERGYAVTVIDNLLTGSRGNLERASGNPNFHFFEADVCEAIAKGQLPLLALHGLQGVLHFACPASPTDFERIPFEILEVDSIGTMRTVALAREYGARYLLASTSETYGDPLVHPQAEDYFGNVNPTGPRACYDETKRFAEAYVSTAIRGVSHSDALQKFAPLDAGIVRIFNTYGPRMRPDDGRVVPELCMQALRGEALTMHGDGLQTRSFCYVSDLVAGIIKLFESDIKIPVNLGNPEERTILDFAKTILRLTESKSTFTHLPARPDDPKRRCPDITRAKSLLRWEARIGIEEGLKRTIEYFKQARGSGNP